MAETPWWTAGDGPPPGPRRAHLLLVGFLVLVVVCLVAGVFVLLRDPGGPLREAAREPDPPPAAEEETAPPDADGKRTPDPRRRPGRPVDLSGLASQVADIRQLPLERRLRARATGVKGLADKVSELAFSELRPGEVARNEQLLVALRLAEPGVDLARRQEELYRSEVLGLYVPEESTLYVRGTKTPVQRATAAHEIAHALQDQAFGLVQLQERYKDRSDAATAVLALVEGDAVLTGQLWAQRHLSAEELQEVAAGGGGGGLPDGTPEYLRQSLIFPYREGSAFVVALYSEGGFEAVDAAFENPPTSTEQIMHPERYRAGDEPVRVRVAGAPGQGWKPATRYELGEFDLAQLLAPLGDDAAVAAEGWGGGTVRSWSRGEQTAVAASVVFDTADDAREACDALPRWYQQVADGQASGEGVYRGDRDVLALRCAGRRVDLGLGPNATVARAGAGR